MGKLKQIAKVREKTAELKSNVEALNLHNGLDDKQKVAFAESIMKLLLKLDTIQVCEHEFFMHSFILLRLFLIFDIYAGD